jgi:hypothetical protein
MATMLAILSLGTNPTTASDDDPGATTIAAETEDMASRSGLLEFFVDEDGGRILLFLPAPDADGEYGRFLYFEGLSTGLGSNPVGLDRNQIGSTRHVVIRKVGARVMIEQLNTAYRALSDDDDERRAARQSFATSVLWAGEIVARDDDGGVLVDLTSFLVRDAHDVVGTLKQSGQGSFSLDAERSAVDLASCLAFPENVVFEALLTFESSDPGDEVRATAPSPNAITLVLHHSIVKLPDDGYRPREFDPRIGHYSVDFRDYAAPLDQPLTRRWIARHRLEKVDPAAPRSRVKEPIVYYLDRGAPEPVRAALLDGALWWAQAFENAGFIDAFRVELLPHDAHPLDVRYNVINWVHRATRGWSYGGGVIDPRTGEIVKGHVLLGSLRVRQDRLLFEGLAGTDSTGTGSADDPVELALARIRQLAAHEVGHTLGLAHNFAASTYGRASVMDYPAPLVEIEDGRLDLTNAYAVGVGAWDIHTIRYGYSQFPPGTDERAALQSIVRDGLDRGLYFLSDTDARPPGAAEPRASLWDNGAVAEQALAHTLSVRRLAIERFGEHNIAVGLPLALLEEVFAPVYFMHRYELDAAAKVIGGLDYAYVVRGDGQPPMRAMDAGRQLEALEVVLRTAAVDNLDIPQSILELLVPRPFGYGRNREQFHSDTLPAFDAVGVAATAARMTAGVLLQPQRCARVVDQHRRNADLPGLENILERIRAEIFAAPVAREAGAAEIQRAVQSAFLDTMLQLVRDRDVPQRVRAPVELALRELRPVFRNRMPALPATAAHRDLLLSQIDRYLERNDSGEPAGDYSPPPPGSPIGSTLPAPLAQCTRETQSQM